MNGPAELSKQELEQLSNGRWTDMDGWVFYVPTRFQRLFRYESIVRFCLAIIATSLVFLEERWWGFAVVIVAIGYDIAINQALWPRRKKWAFWPKVQKRADVALVCGPWIGGIFNPPGISWIICFAMADMVYIYYTHAIRPKDNRMVYSD